MVLCKINTACVAFSITPNVGAGSARPTGSAHVGDVSRCRPEENPTCGKAFQLSFVIIIRCVRPGRDENLLHLPEFYRMLKEYLYVCSPTEGVDADTSKRIVCQPVQMLLSKVAPDSKMHKGISEIVSNHYCPVKK
jgi:hypothetical protein